ncbi:putative protein PLEKHA9 isoform X1 [Microplitis mediator]|uniref:putative protein PLEKHA9 isoform X1 n=1 Tax=Microplitis mediator TaxID=375433 RepID=UPI002555C8BB|nr:putative protein PLEKHA9 isoform X1 [Microplitis mediator]
MSENSNDCNTDNNDENIRHSLELNYGLAIKFPKVINGKINTKNFLAASQAIIKILDKFGKVFAPIKYDMQINIEKIIIKYLANKQEYFTLQDLLLSEQASGKNTIVIDALVWLTRGLRMIQLFIDKIVKNSKAVPAKTGNEAEDLVASVKDSYKESLEPYHGWMAQQLFGVFTNCSSNHLIIFPMTKSYKIIVTDEDDTDEEPTDAVSRKQFAQSGSNHLESSGKFEQRVERKFGYTEIFLK